jgi:hypothetical protein
VTVEYEYDFILSAYRTIFEAKISLKAYSTLHFSATGR